MIYLFWEGEHGEREVTRVYDVPEGTAVTWEAFLTSLGQRPWPGWDGSRPAIEAGQAIRDWNAEVDARLRDNGIGRDWPDRNAAHREWIERQPGVRVVEFVSLD